MRNSSERFFEMNGTPGTAVNPAVALVAALSLFCTAACSNATLHGGTVVAVEAGANVKALPTPVSTKSGILGKAATGASNLPSLAPGIAHSRRKSLPLLRSSIVTCIGADASAFEVKDAMIVQGDKVPQPDTEGRIAFLSTGYNRDLAGTKIASVLDIEKFYLDDPASLRRASVQGSELDDLSYMVATIAVANTVAWNVDLLELDCGTEAKAKELIARCLPGEEQVLIDLAAKQLSAPGACGAKTPFTKRRALATFLSSYVFLRVR